MGMERDGEKRSRLVYPPELMRLRQQADFDPIAEGARYGLTGELSLAIWARVSADATDGIGRRDVQARRRFHALAAVAARRGGRLLPDVGRVTRVGVEITGLALDPWAVDALATRIPGRTTLVDADEQRARARAAQDVSTSPVRPPRTAEAAGTRARFSHGLRAWAVPGSGGAESALDRLRHTRTPATGARSLTDADRATQIAEVVRLDRRGELSAALQRGAPGLADAVAAALHDGAILAPHPVDVWRANVRGLGAELTLAGQGVGRSAARLLGGTRLAKVGQRAFAAADAWSGGAAREWTQRARGWADGVTRRAMAYSERTAEHGAERELAKLSTSGGEPLPVALRARMEALFGHRFAHVRVHTDDAAARAAQSSGARAVTMGSHIYFNRGQFTPGSEAGDRLLLHELTHVVQHDQGRLPQPGGDRIELSSPADPAEREARDMEPRVDEIRQGQPAPPLRPRHGRSRASAAIAQTARPPGLPPSARSPPAESSRRWPAPPGFQAARTASAPPRASTARQAWRTIAPATSTWPTRPTPPSAGSARPGPQRRSRGPPAWPEPYSAKHPDSRSRNIWRSSVTPSSSATSMPSSYSVTGPSRLDAERQTWPAADATNRKLLDDAPHHRSRCGIGNDHPEQVGAADTDQHADSPGSVRVRAATQRGAQLRDISPMNTSGAR